MSQVDRTVHARNLCVFLHDFVGMLEKQLIECHRLSRAAVDGIMLGITQISARTAEERRTANEVLLRTYTNTDAETNTVLSSAQASVDSIFESVNAGTLEHTKALERTSGDASDLLRRSLGLFSKHMEALELLDGKLQKQLVDMMGVLSQDDVIAQRTDHVIEALAALRQTLATIVANFDAACTASEIERHTSTLLASTLHSFTTEDEKRLFKATFPAMMRKAS